MRKGWEYKKLGDCTQILDSQRKPVTKRDRKSGIYPYYGATGIQDYVDKYIFDGRYVLVGEDGAKWSSFTQSAFIIEGKTWVNNHAHVLRTNDFLVDSFLVYFLNYSDLDSYISGAIIRKLTQASLRNIDIPLPPKSTQLAIVSELDKINELIRLKKEQLKGFDNLAQSLFYEMFGDPVENEKGWEVKKLGEVCEVTSAKRVFIDEVVESGVPFIRGTELTALSKLVPGEKMDYTLFITYEHYERLKAITGVPKIGDLLIPSINADGIVWMVDTEDPLYFKDGRVLWVHVNHEYYNSIAIQKLMNVLIKNVFTSMGGATFAELKLFVLRNMNVPTPPLSVQDAFSEKIKQIDAQKLQVKKSIQDLETLLASRMQYWFE